MHHFLYFTYFFEVTFVKFLQWYITKNSNFNNSLKLLELLISSLRKRAWYLIYWAPIILYPNLDYYYYASIIQCPKLDHILCNKQWSTMVNKGDEKTWKQKYTYKMEYTQINKVWRRVWKPNPLWSNQSFTIIKKLQLLQQP